MGIRPIGGGGNNYNSNNVSNNNNQSQNQNQSLFGSSYQRPMEYMPTRMGPCNWPVLSAVLYNGVAGIVNGIAGFFQR